MTSSSTKIEETNQIYTAIIQQRAEWWIGWIEEIPGVNCQEKTRDDLIESLKITLREALEFNRYEAIQAAEEGYQEVAIQVGKDAHYSNTSDNTVVR